MKTNRQGFTLVEIMIVVAIIALLATIAIPSFMKSRQEARRSACINNLRLIDHAKQQYATANNGVQDTDTPPSDEINKYFKSGAAPICPSAGTYTYGAMNVVPVCSKSASPDNHILNVGTN